MMKLQYGMTLVLLLGLAIGVAAAAETSPPSFPQEFYGTVTIDGAPAPAGTTITATIGETTYGSIVTTKAGEYGSSSRHEGGRLVVSATDGHAGETITFLVNGRAARETATFTPDSTTRLDLSVAGESTPAPGNGGNGGGGGPQGSGPAPTSTPSAPTVPVGQASLPLSETGEVSAPVTVRTGDGAGSLTVGEGTRARDKDGNPLGEVTIERADAAGLPPIPPGAAIGFALTCGPSGATFDPPATLTYTLSEEEWGRIGDPATLRVVWYNPGTGAWQEVPATVDPATRTVTAQVSHFSLFALTWAAAPPTGATTGPTGTAPGETPSGPGSEQPAGGETPWALIAVGGLVAAGSLAAGWYFLRKR